MTRPSPIQAARERHRLAEVARRTGLPLNVGTGTVTVRCPLPSHGHPDRTPSLRLYLDDDRYYCFGCAARGDVVQWVQDTEGVGVVAAITVLDSGRALTHAWAGGHKGAAESLGSPDRAETPDPTRTPAERVHAALAIAWDYYTTPSLHARAVAYLAGRGIEVGVLEVHTGQPETGHTPQRADGLINTLRTRGFCDHELLDAGLAQRHLDGGALTDFYRHRVLIPIRDDEQRVVGFIGRNIGDQGRGAKYKNPPRTVVYDKSVNLYQPLPAPTGTKGQVIVVEGTLDALAIAVAAARSGAADRFCPVTQSGRELSPAQLTRVIALHPNPPILGFDGDRAGQDAACRHALAAAAQGWAVSVTVLPDDHDPASWLAEHGESGLQAWVHDDDGRPAPKPVAAATYIAGYLAACRFASSPRLSHSGERSSGLASPLVATEGVGM